MRSRWIPGPAVRRSRRRPGGCGPLLPRARPGTARPGFTLVEALVALVLVTAVVVGAVEAFAAGFRTQAAANEQLIALALAETRLADVAALPLDSLPLDPQLREGGFPPPFERFRWRALVQGDAGAPGLRGVAVLVEWDGGELALETALYRRRARPGGPQGRRP
jgi:type II secretory pathway pseudopilin PulG